MKKTANHIIAEWMGWRWIQPTEKQNFDPYFEDATGDSRHFPFFVEYDAHAITLLPILVARGYSTRLQDMHNGMWTFGIWKDINEAFDYRGESSTIAGAITSAILRLMDKEGPF